MTFTEAAVEILRLVGRPLHYKKITELAIERNLLSHVGKAPELTMSSRLATMVKKDRGDEPILKVKPGVFALREFTAEMMALADSDEDIDLSALPPPSSQKPEPTSSAPVVVSEEVAVVSEGGEVEPVAVAPTPPAAPRRAMPGAEVFPEEEDDDQPILAGLDEEEEEEGEDGRRGRRRRRRRGKEEGGAEAEAGERAEHRGGGGGGERDRERDRDRDRDRDRGERHRDRDRDRDRHRERDRERDRERGDRGERHGRLPQVDLAREPAQDDLLGRDLADAVSSVLASGEMQPLSYAQIAEQLVRRGRLVGDAAALAPTVAAAIRADAKRHERARFRYVEGRVALVDWYLPRDVVRQEKDVVRFAERQRDQVRRAFLRKLQDLPTAGFVEILATWLNAEGVSGLRAVRRPGSSAQEIHLAGVIRRGPEETRVAVLVLRDGREIAREKVVEMRGSLHHYGSASTAWIVSTGAVSPAAREEAAGAGTLPVALYDGGALAEAMESRRIGLVPVSIPISAIDLDLLDALRGRPEPVVRGERDREEGRRDRDERRDRDREERRERDRDRDRERGREKEREPSAAEPAAEEAAAAPAEAAEATTEVGATPEAMQAAQPQEGQGGERERGGRRRRRRRRGRGGAEQAAAGEAMTGAEAGEEEEEESEAEGVEAATSAGEIAAEPEAAAEEEAQALAQETDEEADERAAVEDVEIGEDELEAPEEDEEDEDLDLDEREDEDDDRDEPDVEDETDEDDEER
ncbi:HTH domain-containing protein [Sandaracinus amylolyticus]|uniref:HTH domain-containing protein n=1 Tax=Sandaracinus amylolyticus TaxID=927083 RepID=UPI001F01A6EC|nr:HTH domain-containing protein [Sandaracinus amylolyticus]UJR80582.1 ATP-dependent RNA helicase [Sandaracinus amylolyticus]